MMTPEEMLKFELETARSAIEYARKHLASRKYSAAVNAACGAQVSLYFAALLQLRWSFEGLQKVMADLDSLLPLFDQAFKGQWSVSCELDVHAYLNFLLGRPPVDAMYFKKWASAEGYASYQRTHLCQIELINALNCGSGATMPCSFPASRKYRLEAEQYSNYFELISEIVNGNQTAVSDCVGRAVSIYRRWARNDGGPGYEGSGFVNAVLFDFRLAALLAFATRHKGMDLVVEEPYATVLRNAAAYRDG